MLVAIQVCKESVVWLAHQDLKVLKQRKVKRDAQGRGVPKAFKDHVDCLVN